MMRRSKFAFADLFFFAVTAAQAAGLRASDRPAAPEPAIAFFKTHLMDTAAP
jgi:hypothetical protein